MSTRLFVCDYQFLSCGDVFTRGLSLAAADLGIAYAHATWDAYDLPGLIAAHKPDLLFVVHGRRFCQRFPSPRVFGVPTALWLLDEPYEVDDTASFSAKFDHVFVNDAASASRHQHATPLAVCYDPHVYTTSEAPKGYAVGFIGGGNSTRDRYLAALAHAGLLSYVVGGAWSDPVVNALCLSPNIAPAQTARLYQSTRIILNVFRETHHFNLQRIPAMAMNPRVYEALACGALVVSEWRPEIDERVPMLPTFRTEAECVDLVRDLLADPNRAEWLRAECAARLAGDTYAARLQTVLETCGLAAGMAA